MSSFRPQSDLLHDLGKQTYRWNNLYVKDIHQSGDTYLSNLTVNGNLSIGNTINDLEQTILDIQDSISNGTGGTGTVTTVNTIEPDQNGNIIIASNQISSSFVSSNFSKDLTVNGLDSYIKGIDNKIGLASFKSSDELITGKKTFNKIYITGSIPESVNDDNNWLTAVPNIGWINNKIGDLTGALQYKGMVDANSIELKSASLGDMYTIRSTGVITDTLDFPTNVFKGDILVFKKELSGSIIPDSFDIINLGVGIRSINQIYEPELILTTGDIDEAQGNNSVNGSIRPIKYFFTNERARQAISVTGSLLTYNPSSGVISSSLYQYSNANVAAMLTGSQHSGITFTYNNNVLSASVSGVSNNSGTVTKVNNQIPDSNGYITINTDHISESNNPVNKWYTDARSRSALAGSTYIQYSSGNGQISLISSSLSDFMRDQLITGSFSELNVIAKAPTVKAVSDYINSSVLPNIATNVSESIRNLISAQGDFISYSSVSGIISSSLTPVSIANISRNAISSSDLYVTYNASSGVISSSIFTNFIPRSLIGISGGVAPIGSDGKIGNQYLPNFNVGTVTAGLFSNRPNTGSSVGDAYISTESGSFLWSGTNWLAITTPNSGIQSINNLTGNSISLTTDNVPEGNSNNDRKYFSTERARTSISAAGSYLSYNSSTGVISSSFTDQSSIEKILQLFSGSNQSIQHNGIKYIYDNTNQVISSSLVGVAKEINGVQPNSYGQLYLSASQIGTNNLYNPYYDATDLPSGVTAISGSIYGHINGILKKAVFENEPNTFSFNNVFKENVTFEKSIFVTGSIDASNSVGSILIPTINPPDYSQSTNLKNAVNKEYLQGYINNQGLLRSSNNLSELTANSSIARTNLGLGTASTFNTGTTIGTIPVLVSNGNLPAISGSNLTSLPSISLHSDVSITSPVANQVLTYDSSLNPPRWINKNSSSSKPAFKNSIDSVNDFTDGTNIIIVLLTANTLTLPATSATNHRCIYQIKKYDGNLSDVTINGPLLEANNSSFTLKGQYSSLTVISNNDSGIQKWMII